MDKTTRHLKAASLVPNLVVAQASHERGHRADQRSRTNHRRCVVDHPQALVPAGQRWSAIRVVHSPIVSAAHRPGVARRRRDGLG